LSSLALAFVACQDEGSARDQRADFRLPDDVCDTGMVALDYGRASGEACEVYSCGKPLLEWSRCCFFERLDAAYLLTGSVADDDGQRLEAPIRDQLSADTPDCGFSGRCANFYAERVRIVSMDVDIDGGQMCNP
jgi:hypothetical protein